MQFHFSFNSHIFLLTFLIYFRMFQFFHPIETTTWSRLKPQCVRAPHDINCDKMWKFQSFPMREGTFSKRSKKCLVHNNKSCDVGHCMNIPLSGMEITRVIYNWQLFSYLSTTQNDLIVIPSHVDSFDWVILSIKVIARFAYIRAYTWGLSSACKFLKNHQINGKNTHFVLPPKHKKYFYDDKRRRKDTKSSKRWQFSSIARTIKCRTNCKYLCWGSS